ncbi:hypothetical protein [Pyrobaculum sp.]|uniref:Uncharacterized protein n=1 Tax=Pyrobaculum oguniense (strain DSM 13380 / JCM 10595 / TE7) TaxID=698757 RepID=H6Q735_PYROT|nr:hypothetical protein Pogu_0406 [Pyrobaculum oguniense TE7]
MKIYIRKRDETLIPELVETKPSALKKVRLEDVIIMLDDVDGYKYVDYL